MSEDKARELVERFVQFLEPEERFLQPHAKKILDDARAYLHPLEGVKHRYIVLKVASDDRWIIRDESEPEIIVIDHWFADELLAKEVVSAMNIADKLAESRLSSRLAAAERVVEAAKVACEAFRVANGNATDAKRWIAFDGSSMLNLWKSVHDYDRERGAK